MTTLCNLRQLRVFQSGKINVVILFSLLFKYALAVIMSFSQTAVIYGCVVMNIIVYCKL